MVPLKAESDSKDIETLMGNIISPVSSNQTAGPLIHYPEKASGELRIITAFKCLIYPAVP